MPDCLRGSRGGQPGAEVAFGGGPGAGVGLFGAEKPGLAGHEEEVAERGEGGEVEGVVGEQDFGGGGEGGGGGGEGGGGGGRDEEAGLDLDLAALDDG